jgi:hypothetical protein
VLKTIRQQRAASLVTVMVALVAWFFVSNRCGIALMLPQVAGAEAHRCCQPEAPVQKAPVDHSPLCCKSLAVTVVENSPLDSFHPPVVATDFSAWVEVAPAVMARPQQGWTTGPPEAPPLISCILVASLQAHGPPAHA